MSDVPQEWIEAFGVGWHSVPEGEPGDRRRAGLRAVEPLIRANERERLAGAARAGLESQEALDVMVELIATVRADERERVHHWSHKCRFCDVTHHYDDYVGERRAHQRTTGMAPTMGWTCVCGRWVDRIEDWHAHLTGADDVEPEVPDPTVGTNSARLHMDCALGDCLVARTLKNPDIPCPVNPPEVTPDMLATRQFWIWLDGRWATQGGVAKDFMKGMSEG